jgi:hypothetical protein
MKPLWIIAVASLLIACQANKAATDQPAKDKVQRDADRDRKVNNVQEQWRGQVQH